MSHHSDHDHKGHDQKDHDHKDHDHKAQSSSTRAPRFLPEAYGTPMIKKTPIDFDRRKAALEKSNSDAMK